jgi:prevent-host-death family protein
MHVSVTQAKGQLTELVRRAEAGEEGILARHGHGAVRLTPLEATTTAESRKALLPTEGESAERSHDFLYDRDGLPG